MPTRDRRLMPRPLPAHLASAMWLWLSSRAGLTSLASGSPPWNTPPWNAPPSPELRVLAAEIAQRGAEPVVAALDRLLRGRAEAFISGLEAYRRHPYCRSADTMPVCWCDGSSSLLDYGQPGARGAVLLVPSLINRHYILDLLPERSFARFLADQGLRPLVLDWGEPGAEERDFTLADYVLRRLRPALATAAALARGPVHVCGYCMGGLLTLALAAHGTATIASLVLLATPWDFHAERPAVHQFLGTLVEHADLLRDGDPIPVSVIQSLFVALDPFLAERKFIRFAGLPADSEAARDFVVLEDWLNDGVPLAQGVARECGRAWYLANEPGNGTWRVAGKAVVPAAMTLPSLVVLPRRDRIVPPLTAAPLAEALPRATVLRPALGHIGMMSSAEAPGAVWQPIAEWLRALL